MRKPRERAIAELGGSCVCCGETEAEFLEFDHIAPRGGRFDRKNLGISQQALMTLVGKGQRKGEIQLLCSNCHKAKSRRGICPHEST